MEHITGKVQEIKRKNDKRIRNVLFFSACVILLGWMALIFWFSAQPVIRSVGMSREVGMTLAGWFVPGFEQWDQGRQMAFAMEIDFGLRKCAHFMEYMILGILWERMLSNWMVKWKQKVSVAVLGCMLFAAGDEFHQLFVEGRSCRWQDVCIDTAGALTGILLILWTRYLIRRKKEKKKCAKGTCF